MRTIFAKPMVAIVFGAFLICAEACLHAESLRAFPQDWLSLPLHDWMAGGFLMWAGFLSRKDWARGRLFQIAAWGFMSSLLVAAFFGHLEEWTVQPEAGDWLSGGVLVAILAALLAIALGGLAGTITRK